MKKLLLLLLSITISTNAFAFGGMLGGGSGHSTQRYQKGVNAYGIHVGGEGQAKIEFRDCSEEEVWTGNECCPLERYLTQKGKCCAEGEKADSEGLGCVKSANSGALPPCEEGYELGSDGWCHEICQGDLIYSNGACVPCGEDCEKLNATSCVCFPTATHITCADGYSLDAWLKCCADGASSECDEMTNNNGVPLENKEGWAGLVMDDNSATYVWAKMMVAEKRKVGREYIVDVYQMGPGSWKLDYDAENGSFKVTDYYLASKDNVGSVVWYANSFEEIENTPLKTGATTSSILRFFGIKSAIAGNTREGTDTDKWREMKGSDGRACHEKEQEQEACRKAGGTPKCFLSRYDRDGCMCTCVKGGKYSCPSGTWGPYYSSTTGFMTCSCFGDNGQDPNGIDCDVIRVVNPNGVGNTIQLMICNHCDKEVCLSGQTPYCTTSKCDPNDYDCCDNDELYWNEKTHRLDCCNGDGYIEDGECKHCGSGNTRYCKTMDSDGNCSEYDCCESDNYRNATSYADGVCCDRKNVFCDQVDTNGNCIHYSCCSGEPVSLDSSPGLQVCCSKEDEGIYCKESSDSGACLSIGCCPKGRKKRSSSIGYLGKYPGICCENGGEVFTETGNESHTLGCCKPGEFVKDTGDSSYPQVCCPTDTDHPYYNGSSYGSAYSCCSTDYYKDAHEAETAVCCDTLAQLALIKKTGWFSGIFSKDEYVCCGDGQVAKSTGDTSRPQVCCDVVSGPVYKKGDGTYSCCADGQVVKDTGDSSDPQVCCDDATGHVYAPSLGAYACCVGQSQDATARANGKCCVDGVDGEPYCSYQGAFECIEYSCCPLGQKRFKHSDSSAVEFCCTDDRVVTKNNYSSCCGEDEVAVGEENNKICCKIGQKNSNGICCEQDEVTLLDSENGKHCCPSSADKVTSTGACCAPHQIIEDDKCVCERPAEGCEDPDKEWSREECACVCPSGTEQFGSGCCPEYQITEDGLQCCPEYMLPVSVTKKNGTKYYGCCDREEYSNGAIGGYISYGRVVCCTRAKWKEADNGEGLCCPNETDELCNNTCYEACPEGQTRNTETCECECPTDKPEECKGTCYEACPEGQTRNAETCECECPTDKPEECKGTCYEACPEGQTRNAETCICEGTCSLSDDNVTKECCDAVNGDYTEDLENHTVKCCVEEEFAMNWFERMLISQAYAAPKCYISCMKGYERNEEGSCVIKCQNGEERYCRERNAEGKCTWHDCCLSGKLADEKDGVRVCCAENESVVDGVCCTSDKIAAGICCTNASYCKQTAFDGKCAEYACCDDGTLTQRDSSGLQQCCNDENEAVGTECCDSGKVAIWDGVKTCCEGNTVPSGNEGYQTCCPEGESQTEYWDGQGNGHFICCESGKADGNGNCCSSSDELINTDPAPYGNHPHFNVCCASDRVAKNGDSKVCCGDNEEVVGEGDSRSCCASDKVVTKDGVRTCCNGDNEEVVEINGNKECKEKCPEGGSYSQDGTHCCKDNYEWIEGSGYNYVNAEVCGCPEGVEPTDGKYCCKNGYTFGKPAMHNGHWGHNTGSGSGYNAVLPSECGCPDGWTKADKFNSCCNDGFMLIGKDEQGEAVTEFDSGSHCCPEGQTQSEYWDEQGNGHFVCCESGKADGNGNCCSSSDELINTDPAPYGNHPHFNVCCDSGKVAIWDGVKTCCEGNTVPSGNEGYQTCCPEGESQTEYWDEQGNGHFICCESGKADGNGNCCSSSDELINTDPEPYGKHPHFNVCCNSEKVATNGEKKTCCGENEEPSGAESAQICCGLGETNVDGECCALENIKEDGETKLCCPTPMDEVCQGHCVTACPEGKERNTESCECECPADKPDVCQETCYEACPEGKTRNEESCECECPADKPDVCQETCYEACPEGQTRNEESCECECPADKPDVCQETCYEACPEGKTRNEESCECECPADKPEECNGACYEACADDETRNTETCECKKTCNADGTDSNGVATEECCTKAGGNLHEDVCCSGDTEKPWSALNGGPNAVCCMWQTDGSATEDGACCYQDSAIDMVTGQDSQSCCEFYEKEWINGACCNPNKVATNNDVKTCCGNEEYVKGEANAQVCCENETDEVCKNTCYEACPEGKERNTESCECECPADKPDVCQETCYEACPEGQERNEETCECEEVCPDGGKRSEVEGSEDVCCKDNKAWDGEGYNEVNGEACGCPDGGEKKKIEYDGWEDQVCCKDNKAWDGEGYNEVRGEACGCPDGGTSSTEEGQVGVCCKDNKAWDGSGYTEINVGACGCPDGGEKKKVDEYDSYTCCKDNKDISFETGKYEYFYPEVCGCPDGGEKKEVDGMTYCCKGNYSWSIWSDNGNGGYEEVIPGVCGCPDGGEVSEYGEYTECCKNHMMWYDGEYGWVSAQVCGCPDGGKPSEVEGSENVCCKDGKAYGYNEGNGYEYELIELCGCPDGKELVGEECCDSSKIATNGEEKICCGENEEASGEEGSQICCEKGQTNIDGSCCWNQDIVDGICCWEGAETCQGGCYEPCGEWGKRNEDCTCGCEAGYTRCGDECVADCEGDLILDNGTCQCACPDGGSPSTDEGYEDVCCKDNKRWNGESYNEWDTTCGCPDGGSPSTEEGQGDVCCKGNYALGWDGKYNEVYPQACGCPDGSTRSDEDPEICCGVGGIAYSNGTASDPANTPNATVCACYENEWVGSDGMACCADNGYSRGEGPTENCCTAGSGWWNSEKSVCCATSYGEGYELNADLTEDCCYGEHQWDSENNECYQCNEKGEEETGVTERCCNAQDNHTYIEEDGEAICLDCSSGDGYDADGNLRQECCSMFNGTWTSENGYDECCTG